MSISAVAPTPSYQDPDRLQIPMPGEVAENGAATQGDKKHLTFFAEGDDSPSFWDFLDIINPLQHIPIVADIYQELTGDKIGVGARVAGGALFGGPLGAIGSLINCAIEENTGEDIDGRVIAAFRGDKTDDATATAVAGGTAPGQDSLPQGVATVEPPVPVAAPQDKVQKNQVPAADAPAITLPDSGAGTPAKRTSFYTIDDGKTVSPETTQLQAQIQAQAAAQAAALTAANATPTTATKTAPSGGPTSLGKSDRVMPAPARTLVQPKAAPTITVPVSTSQTNSSVPVTGRNTAAGTVPTPTPTADGAAEGQAAAGQDWFTAAWGEALDKYQKANRRNDSVTETNTVN